MLEHSFRVRAARRRGKAEALIFLLFQRPLHPANRSAFYMPGTRIRRPEIVHARAQRKRSWAAVSFSKTENILACLRGAVSGGAEKNKGYRTSRNNFIDEKRPLFGAFFD